MRDCCSRHHPENCSSMHQKSGFSFTWVRNKSGADGSISSLLAMKQPWPCLFSDEESIDISFPSFEIDGWKQSLGFGYFQNKIFDLKGNIYSRRLIENTLALSLSLCVSCVCVCAHPGFPPGPDLCRLHCGFIDFTFCSLLWRNESLGAVGIGMQGNRVQEVHGGPVPFWPSANVPSWRRDGWRGASAAVTCELWRSPRRAYSSFRKRPRRDVDLVTSSKDWPCQSAQSCWSGEWC